MKLTHRAAVVPVAAVVSVLAAFTFAAPAGGAPVTAVPSVKVTATVAVGARPLAVAVNPLANTVYVANAHGHSVSVVNGQTNTVVATVPVRRLPQGVAVNQATGRIYVANTNSGTVSVINGQTNMVVATVPARRGPQGLPPTRGPTPFMSPRSSATRCR